MFGPDRCGSSNTVHFIFRHKHPKTGEYEEKHLQKAPSPKRDKLNHLYTLIVRPDNSFEILIDAVSSRNGSLLENFKPPVNPPKEIPDPTDVKPSDWVDRARIEDPTATKPDDWDEDQPPSIPDPEKLDPPEGWLVDEPRTIPDPNAAEPADWDTDLHGAWERPQILNPKCTGKQGCGKYNPPTIRNPLYKGKWRAPMIDNPDYKGEWKAKLIPNDDYYEDPEPHNFEPLIGAGFELWMVNKNSGFNNIWIGTDEEAVRKWNEDHFKPKFEEQTRVHDEAEAKEREERQARAKEERERREKEEAERKAAEATPTPEPEADKEAEEKPKEEAAPEKANEEAAPEKAPEEKTSEEAPKKAAEEKAPENPAGDNL
jgi:calnexin